MPVAPKIGERPAEGRFLIGVALNGVVFDPGTAEYWAERPSVRLELRCPLSGKINLGLDQNNAHVQPTGHITITVFPPV